jgi:hypothetical protein
MRHVGYRLAPSCQVIASASPARERSAARDNTVAWYCSGVPARLAGHDYATRPRVL